MLQLNLSTDPQWLDLGHSVQIRVVPMPTALMMAARQKAQGQIDMPNDTMGDGVDPETTLDTDAMAKAIARIAIKDWAGVGDENGDPAPVSPQGIEALPDIWPLFEAFQTKYVARALILNAEKNALPLLPTGSSAGGGAYCAACPSYEGRAQNCPDCPQVLNAPKTYEDWQIWDLVRRLGGQLRMSDTSVIGWDMSAALQIGAALGVPSMAIAELLPPVEAVMVRKMNEELQPRVAVNWPHSLLL